jgi:hypothetical protein
MVVSSEFKLKLKEITRFTVDGLQQLLALVLPFDLGDSILLGDVSLLALGFVALRLEPTGIAVTVAQAGGRRIVVRPRGVVWHGRSRGRRRSGVPLDEPENTKRIVRNKMKSGKS